MRRQRSIAVVRLERALRGCKDDFARWGERALNSPSSVLHDQRDRDASVARVQAEHASVALRATSRSPSPLRRALLGAFVGVLVLLCAHAIGGAQDVGRGRETAASIANAESSAVRPRTSSPPTPRTAELVAITVARACWLEAGWSLSDCAAIAYVLKARARRSGWSVLRTTLAYSALDADTPRAAVARSLPAGDHAGFSSRENERWALLRATARAALEGRVGNPAPGARHWGARNLPSDVRRAARAIRSGRWRSIESETRNAFYAEVPR